MFDLNFKSLIILAFIGVILGVWKMIDLLIWLFSHIKFVF